MGGSAGNSGEIEGLAAMLGIIILVLVFGAFLFGVLRSLHHR